MVVLAPYAKSETRVVLPLDFETCDIDSDSVTLSSPVSNKLFS